MAATDAAKASEMVVRQISWLRVYCVELHALEQPGMPAEEHQRVMTLRQEAPQFFWLVSILLKDALILGLYNLLDTPESRSKEQLTIENLARSLTDPGMRECCTKKLKQIREGTCYREVKIARNNLIAHPNRRMLLRYDEMSGEVDFPHMTIPKLEELLEQAAFLVEHVLSKSHLVFRFADWEGVSHLFNRLRPQPKG